MEIDSAISGKTGNIGAKELNITINNSGRLRKIADIHIAGGSQAIVSRKRKVIKILSIGSKEYFCAGYFTVFFLIICFLFDSVG